MYFRIPVRLASVLSLLMIVAVACQGRAAPTATADQSSVTAVATSPAGTEAGGPQPVDVPDKRLDHAGDVNSSANAKKKMVSGGDVFVSGLYERPFNANAMDTYFPYLDIVDFQGFMNDSWGYAAITMAGTDANEKLPGKYAVELDVNKDGRGDYLIIASSPTSTDWTSQGVQVFQDADHDIGGSVPLVAEKKPSGGTGYEKLIFDGAKGSSADGAFVKIVPDDSKTVMIGFKLSLFKNPTSFAMGGWAGTDALDPARFDFNDQMTHAEAGSPLPTYEVYPLKALAEIDNTCRLAIGFSGTSKVPGLCSAVERQQAEGGGGGTTVLFANPLNPVVQPAFP
jgi:hypothetical protein